MFAVSVLAAAFSSETAILLLRHTAANREQGIAATGTAKPPAVYRQRHDGSD